jgi:inactivated superfamily I helicase
VVRVVVPGLRLRRWRPFTVRLDLSGARPILRLHLHLSERLAHELAEHLAKRRMAQVVAEIRQRTGEPMRQALAQRLHRKLVRHGITPPEGASARLAGWLAEAVVRTVAGQLPADAATLASAAKDPAAGVTLSFAFPFASKAALAAGHGEKPRLHIHSGVHRD